MALDYRVGCGVAPRTPANDDFKGMTWAESRALAEMVFSGKTPDGKRMVVYAEWIDGEETRRYKRLWRYRIVGHLIDEPGNIPGIEPQEDDPYGAPFQRQLR